ncbi:MAG: Holliday junction resolvase RuvX [Betaproteobacteria bacterium]|nr:Holliday junction resolvase RuvX [Betaproteobacteria bacterium]MDE2621739.1 Holliday junction resolvase RuvX [Betaproteobacteria bacterium]
MPEAGTVLAFDFGLKHTGVALGELGSGLCRPLATIHCASRADRWKAVERLMKEWEPVRLVVGLPLDADGNEQETTRQCRNFATELESRTGLPTALVDERYTSLEADAALREQGYTQQQRAEAEHAEAAALILRSYLESRAP